MITPNQHEKSEWSRMARAAYAADHNDVGHRYSAAAALPIAAQMTIARFDDLQGGYRSWLCWNDFAAASWAINPKPYYHADNWR